MFKNKTNILLGVECEVIGHSKILNCFMCKHEKFKLLSIYSQNMVTKNKGFPVLIVKCICEKCKVANYFTTDRVRSIKI